MKRMLLLLCLAFSLQCWSQEHYSYKSGGRIVDSNNKVMKTFDLRARYGANTEFLKLYNAGRTKKSVGNVLFYSSLGTFVGKFLSDAYSPNKIQNEMVYNRTDNTLYYVCAGVFVASIPIKIGYPRKIKKAVELLNSDPGNVPQPADHSQHLILDSNGLGIRMTF